MAVTKITKVCEGCGTTFEPKRVWQANRFCTRPCANRSRNAKSYPCMDDNGRTRTVHRVLAEAAVGHPLPRYVEVHHVDGTKSVKSQLVICPDHAYHMLLHRRARIKKAGGNPNTDAICGRCRLVLPLTAFWPNRAQTFGYSRRCRLCDQAAQVIRTARWRARRRGQRA